MSTVIKNSSVIFVYIFLTVAMTWPVVPRMASHVVGVGGDAWQTMWRFEHKDGLLRQAIGEGRAGSFLLEEFFGRAEPQLVNLSVWPWMPLHWLFGQPVAYNLVWLLSYVLSGYGMYLLVRYLIKQFGSEELQERKLHIGQWSLSIPEVTAVISGMYYMFLPYHVAHSMGHFGAMQIQWLPFIILAGTAWIIQPQWWKAIALALLIVIQAWTEHHYLLWLVFFVPVALIFYWRYAKANAISLQPLLSKLAISQLAVALGTVVLFGALSYIPTARLALQQDTSLNLGREQLIRFSADLFSFVTPSSWHSVWGEVSYTGFAQYFTGNIHENTQYVGWVVLLLVIFFHQKIPKYPKRFWVTVIAIFFIISLGPQLHVFGKVLPVPLPYELVDSLPIISAVRAVARAGVFVGLGMAVLLGWVLATQLHRKQSVAFIACLILFEFLFFPVPIQSAVLSPAYTAVQEWSGKRILEIPAATNYVIASRALYASTLHGKEVLGNIALERALDEEAFETAKLTPGIRQLLYLRTTELREDRNEFFNQDIAATLVEALEWYDVSGIVMHPDSLAPLQTESIRAFLEQDVRLIPQEFDDVIVYRVSDIADQIEQDGIFLVREEGWDNIGFDPDRNSVFAEILERAGVVLVNTTNEPKQIQLNFDIAAASHDDIAIVSKEGTPLGTAFTIQPGETSIWFVNQGESKAIIQNPELIVNAP